jgi:1-acyl-sn-glycerol-3-phosphate acyltransferase
VLRKLRIAVITNPIAAFAVFGMGVTTAVSHLIDRSGRTGHWVAALWSKFLIKMAGVKLRVAGAERMPLSGRVLLVSNHQSMMDIPVLIASLPGEFRFMAKTSLFSLPFIGWHLSLGGHVPVDRENKRAAVKALAEARRKVEAGTPVLVFAEGSRSLGGIKPFKPGAAHLALKTNATVVPVMLDGTRNALPKGSVQVRPAQVRLKVGEPIPPGAFTGAKELTAEIQRRIEAMFAEPAADA